MTLTQLLKRQEGLLCLEMKRLTSQLIFSIQMVHSFVSYKSDFRESIYIKYITPAI